MLDLGDVITVPDGVVPEGDGLADLARGMWYPGNPAAGVVLASSGRTIAEAAGVLVARFGVSVERARDDALAFAWELNRALLLNVERRAGRFARWRAWLTLAVRLAPAGRVPPMVARRRSLDTSTRARAALSCARGLVGRGVALAVAVAVAGLQLSVVAGGTSYVLALVAGLSAGVALVVHEVGHAAALGAMPAAIVTAGPRTFVLHGALEGVRRSVVAVAGPSLPALAGVGLATAALWTRTDELSVASCPLAAHVLGVTLLTSDGRAACGL